MQNELNFSHHTIQVTSPTTHTRFWKKVRKTDSCWQWLGCVDEFGYGRIAVGGGRTLRAHVLSWLIHRGELPEGRCVLHRCDNPPCTNPEHLWTGTKKDNGRDMAQKGRVAHSERHRSAKLTKAIADKIRVLSECGATQASLGRAYGVSYQAIQKIINGRSWFH